MPLINPEAPRRPRGRPITTGSSKHSEIRWRPSDGERAILDQVKTPGESDADVCRRALRLLGGVSGS